MRIRWSRQASDDVERLHAFLLPLDPQAAAKVVGFLLSAPDDLVRHPRLGQRLEVYAPREVRRLRTEDYEIRYEVDRDLILILRVWHQREDR